MYIVSTYTMFIEINLSSQEFLPPVDQFPSVVESINLDRVKNCTEVIFAVEGRKWILFLIKFYSNELFEEVVFAGVRVNR